MRRDTAGRVRQQAPNKGWKGRPGKAHGAGYGSPEEQLVLLGHHPQGPTRLHPMSWSWRVRMETKSPPLLPCETLRFCTCKDSLWHLPRELAMEEAPPSGAGWRRGLEETARLRTHSQGLAASGARYSSLSPALLVIFLQLPGSRWSFGI